jgi:hypothetical protein
MNNELTVTDLINALEKVGNSVALSNESRDAAKWASCILATLRGETSTAWADTAEKLYNATINLGNKLLDNH